MIAKYAGVALHKCDVIFVVLTKKYIGSTYCRNELFLAYDENKQIVPVTFESDITYKGHNWDGYVSHYLISTIIFNLLFENLAMLILQNEQRPV